MSEEDMPLFLKALMLLNQEKNNEGVVEVGYQVYKKFVQKNDANHLIDNPAPKPDTPIEQAIWWTENRRWNNGRPPKLDVIEFTKMWENCERFSEFLMKSGYNKDSAKYTVKRHRKNGINLKTLKGNKKTGEWPV